jgi:hypothetical protein
VALTLRSITNKLPQGLVTKCNVNERLSKMLKFTYFVADDVIKVQIGVDKPVNYGILFVMMVVLSYVPTFLLKTIFESLGSKKILYHGSE